MDNIEAKLSVLETWAKKGVPYIPQRPGPKASRVERQYDYFPKNKSAFCSWTAEDNCPRTVELFPQLLGIRSLSRETIDDPEYAALHDRMEAALAKLKERQAASAIVADTARQLDELTSDRDRWKRIAEVQEVDVRALRERAAGAEENFRKERRARLSNERLLNTTIDELTAQVAALTATVSKVTGLKLTGKKS
ncbi:hypothetical protein PQR34_14490 [Paraburkholderia sediminicola]|uniref:hypothetical protein n=1 Tax=Paraburkholderia sediminicola TaxID=458836 RepID=UPI0038BC088B